MRSVPNPDVLVLWSPTTPAPAAPTRAQRRATQDDERASAAALARLAVARVRNVDPADVVVGRRCLTCGSTAHGQPVTDGASVSLSHTRGLAVAAASTAGPVGVDAEPLTQTVFAGFDDVALARDEAAALAPDDATGRLRAWVRKEAVLKACGWGLSIDPRLVVLTPDGRIADAPPQVGRPAVGDLTFESAAIGALAYPTGAAVVVERVTR